jgi:hypothetical protein
MSHPTNSADSAGQPWKGRQFDTNSFSGDDGSAPAELIAALSAFASGTGGEHAVVDAFRTSRLLIPLVAHVGDVGVNEHGQQVDKTQELSIVTVAGPDGRNVLPVFSSVTAMQAWNSIARPVPADGIRVALAAASEQTDLVVLDPTSETEFAIRRPALWAIAQSLPWQPAYANPDVLDAFLASARSELAVLDVRLAAGDPRARLAGPEVIAHLELIDSLTRAELDTVLARLAQRWAASDVIATMVDSLAVRLEASA